MKGTLARHAILWMTVFPVLVQALPKGAAFHETDGFGALTKAQLSEGQSAVLNELNLTNAQGKPAPLGWEDPRVKILFNRGWALAGEWAARFFDANPQPSDSQLQHVFDQFGPAPDGIKSRTATFWNTITIVFQAA